MTNQITHFFMDELYHNINRLNKYLTTYEDKPEFLQQAKAKMDEHLENIDDIMTVRHIEGSASPSLVDSWATEIDQITAICKKIHDDSIAYIKQNGEVDSYTAYAQLLAAMVVFSFDLGMRP